MNDNSELTSRIIGITYPFILLFGLYIVLNGHITPGGGFQGGAILSAVFISRYLVMPIDDIRLNSLQIIEKTSYIFIVCIPMFFSLMILNAKSTIANEIYLIVMNILIGIKVCCGLSIVFFRFMFYESR